MTPEEAKIYNLERMLIEAKREVAHLEYMLSLYQSDVTQQAEWETVNFLVAGSIPAVGAKNAGVENAYRTIPRVNIT